MPHYLNTMYSEQYKPYTSYPEKLCRYLVDRYALPAQGMLLDVGCGRGDFLRAFADRGWKAIGVDRCRSEATIAQKLDIRQADFERERFPFDDNTFDVVFTKSVIEHLHNPENFIAESKRVLKPGGRIIVMTPDWQTQRYVFYNDHTHVQPYITSGLANLLKLYEFSEVVSALFYQLPSVWRFPWLTYVYKPLQLFFPVKKMRPSSWWRWSRELMILGTGIK